MDSEFPEIRSTDSPSGEHLIFGCDTGKGMVAENDSDPGILQPPYTFLLRTV